MASHISIGGPGFGTSSTARGVTTAVRTSASTIVKPIALDRGNVLRIHNGAGTRIRAASGVLWITEEHSLEDHVLLPGAAVVLAKTGMAIVLAHRPARIVLEVPHGVAPPRAVEMALADGEPGRRIALTTTTPVARGIATVLREASASIRTIARTLAARRNVADVSTIETDAPMTHSDGLPPMHLQRRKMNGAHEVERAVIDEWTFWRK